MNMFITWDILISFATTIFYIYDKTDYGKITNLKRTESNVKAKIKYFIK